jgi:hypothetical protein
MLRSVDAVDYLRLKSMFKPSDCNALFSDGRKLPVLIRTVNGAQQCAVEINDQLFEAAKVTGFLRYQQIPQPIVEVPPPPEPTETELFEAAVREEKKLNPNESEWVIRRRVNARFFRQGLARQQHTNKQQHDLTVPDKWASFAAAAKRARNS